MTVEHRRDRRVSTDQEASAFAFDDPSGVATPRVAPNTRTPVLDLDCANEQIAVRRRDGRGLVPAKLADGRIGPAGQQV